MQDRKIQKPISLLFKSIDPVSVTSSASAASPIPPARGVDTNNQLLKMAALKMDANTIVIDLNEELSNAKLDCLAQLIHILNTDLVLAGYYRLGIKRVELKNTYVRLIPKLRAIDSVKSAQILVKTPGDRIREALGLAAKPLADSAMAEQAVPPKKYAIISTLMGEGVCGQVYSSDHTLILSYHQYEPKARINSKTLLKRRIVKALSQFNIPLQALLNAEGKVTDYVYANGAEHEYEMLQLAADIYHPKKLQYHWKHNFYTLISRRFPGENLLTILNRSSKLTTLHTLQLFYNGLLALRQLHSFGIVHRDLKPDNIIYDKKTGRVYVIDLGLAKLATTNSRYCDVGAVHYRSVEAAKNGNTCILSDIVSFEKICLLFFGSPFLYEELLPCDTDANRIRSVLRLQSGYMPSFENVFGKPSDNPKLNRLYGELYELFVWQNKEDLAQRATDDQSLAFLERVIKQYYPEQAFFNTMNSKNIAPVAVPAPDRSAMFKNPALLFPAPTSSSSPSIRQAVTTAATTNNTSSPTSLVSHPVAPLSQPSQVTGPVQNALAMTDASVVSSFTPK